MATSLFLQTLLLLWPPPTSWGETTKRIRSRVYLVSCGTKKASGFLAFDRKHILTSLSVAGCGRQVWIQRDKEKKLLPAALVAYDKEFDAALLSVKEPMKGRPLPFGSPRDVRVGLEVSAIGHPYPAEGIIQKLTQKALNWSLTRGAIGRLTKKFAQVTMPLMTGYAGAPLFNKQGFVVGMLTQLGPKRYPIGLATRLPTLKKLYKTTPRIKKGWPGFDFKLNVLARFSFALGKSSNSTISPTSQELRVDFVFWDQWVISGLVGFDLLSLQVDLDLSLLFGAETSYKILMPRELRPYLNYLAVGVGFTAMQLQLTTPVPKQDQDLPDSVNIMSDFRASLWIGLRFYSVVGQFSVGVFMDFRELFDPTIPVNPVLSFSWGL